MNKHRFYRVRELKDYTGKTVFMVDACETKLEVLFGFWFHNYTKENRTLQDAKEHINDLISWRLKSEKVVFKRTIKK